jgi:hypothetical protein
VIDGGSGADVFVYTASGQTLGTAISGSEISLAGVDRLSGVTVGDRLDLSAYASSVLTTSATYAATVNGTTSSTLLADGRGGSVLASFGRGNILGTGVFAYSSTGSDLLFQFDSNGAGTAGVETVVLVGASAITGVIANTAGILTFV